MNRSFAGNRCFLRGRGLCLLLLALLLLAPLAQAEEWGCRAYLEGKYWIDGTPGETLLSYEQKIEQTFESGALRVDMAGAIFDGYTLVLTWTAENTGSEPVFVLCDLACTRGKMAWEGMEEAVLAPGESLPSGIVAEVFGPDGGADPLEEVDAGMAYAAYRITGEAVVAPMDSAKQLEEARAWGRAQAAQGNFPMDRYGYPIHREAFRREGMTHAEAAEASGLLEAVDALSFSLPIRSNMRTVSLLPEGAPVQQALEGYALRIVRADMSLNTLTLEIERVFGTPEAAAPYLPDAPPEGYGWRFAAMDESGGERWSMIHGGGPETLGPEPNGAGEWVWPYRYQAMGFQRLPQTLTVVSRRGPGEDSPAVPLVWAEAVALTVPDGAWEEKQ